MEKFGLRLTFNLINDISTYVYNIKDINSNNEFIQKRKSLLTKFDNHLKSIQINGVDYRLMEEELLLNVEIEDKTFSINLARKFYRYRKAANRKVNEGNNNEDLSLIDQKKCIFSVVRQH